MSGVNVWVVFDVQDEYERPVLGVFDNLAKWEAFRAALPPEVAAYAASQAR